jgi:hypothetical protein
VEKWNVAKITVARITAAKKVAVSRNVALTQQP